MTQPEDGPEKWVPEAIAEQEAYIDRFKADKAAKNGRCEETVMVNGQPQACDRPLDDRGYCGHERDHVE